MDRSRRDDACQHWISSPFHVERQPTIGSDNLRRRAAFPAHERQLQQALPDERGVIQIGFDSLRNHSGTATVLCMYQNDSVCGHLNMYAFTSQMVFRFSPTNDCGLVMLGGFGYSNKDTSVCRKYRGMLDWLQGAAVSAPERFPGVWLLPCLTQ